MLGVAGGLLAGAFVAHKVEEHKHHNHFWSGGSKLPLAAGAGGLIGSMVGNHLPFGTSNNNAVSSPAPQPQYNPPQPQYSPPQHHGMGSYMPAVFGGGGNEPRLNIHCAAYCDQDVTNAVRSIDRKSVV